MPDWMSKEQRSRHMALIRGRNTRFEIAIIRTISAELYPLGYRYRKHYGGVIGTPDIAFVRQHIAIFFDSDFWHGKNYARLKDRMDLEWRAKIERNIEKDREVNKALRRAGWKVLRFDEQHVKYKSSSVVQRIRRALVDRNFRSTPSS